MHLEMLISAYLKRLCFKTI